MVYVYVVGYIGEDKDGHYPKLNSTTFTGNGLGPLKAGRKL